MNDLEREVLEKFHLLNRDSQQRVRKLLLHETELIDPYDLSEFDYKAWFQDIEFLRQEISEGNGGKMPSIDVVSLLRDIRDGEDE